jgi:hypothetical protein
MMFATILLHLRGSPVSDVSMVEMKIGPPFHKSRKDGSIYRYFKQPIYF